MPKLNKVHKGEENWSPASWKTKLAAQQPQYSDRKRLTRTVEKLANLPPLVTSWEIESLKTQLAEAAQGKQFLLQGGDCSESFEDCKSPIIAIKLKILLQMSLVLIHGAQKQVIRMGRFAGQFAKPRSKDHETRNDVSLPSYRGDLINSLPFTEEDREPNPELLLRGYEKAALTLNFVRSLSDGGFADLHHPEYWELDFVKEFPKAAQYQERVRTLSESLSFFETLAGKVVGKIRRMDFYTSHEGLHLQYEQAQTRFIERVGKWFNLTTHFPWIGNRTRQIDGAHVEYFRGLSNPIGIKIGSSLEPDELVALLEALNPQNEPGRITLIHRFGDTEIEKYLPSLIRSVQQAGQIVLWACDPMHGNTELAASGYKTRNFKRILSEVDQSFDIHEGLGSRLGGLHVELTGENVTECVGGARGLTEDDLGIDYRTQVDPRLNYEQALEIALLVAGRLEKSRG